MSGVYSRILDDVLFMKASYSTRKVEIVQGFTSGVGGASHWPMHAIKTATSLHVSHLSFPTFPCSLLIKQGKKINKYKNNVPI